MAAKKKISTSTTGKRTSTTIKTVREFKVWIAALEEFQAEDWHPNVEQWSIIRDKINKLEDNQSIGASVSSPRESARNFGFEEEMPTSLVYSGSTHPAPATHFYPSVQTTAAANGFGTPGTVTHVSDPHAPSPFE